MSSAPRTWVNTKDKTVEGHTNTAALYFDGNPNPLWGPNGCHDNTVDIQTALRQADPRLELRMERKGHSVEGHTRTFNVEARGQTLLQNHSCHDNMESLSSTINTIWAVSPPN